MESDTFTISLKPNCQQNYVQLSSNGGRIFKLVLGGITVIEALEPKLDLGSGSFLMYPWVSKLEKPQTPYDPVFQAGDGNPIHGMVVNREVNIDQKNVDESIEITIRLKEESKEVASFVQTFTLSENKLKVKLQITGESTLPVCFGYHPYLQINQTSISHLKFETNLSTNVKLDEHTLLPIVPFVKNEIQISPEHRYNSLFFSSNQGDTYFRLKNEETTVEIRSPNLKWWQIYSPEDGKRIAVEPMSFLGNIYSIYKKEEFGELLREGEFTIVVK